MNEENKTDATEEEVKSAPLEKLPDLKAIREERGMTIQDIFLKTRINTTVLNAIENNEFHLLTAPFYAKRFIESYAKTIGIDPETVLAPYLRYLDKQPRVPEEVKDVEAPIALDRKPFKRFLLYAVPAVAIVAAVLIIVAFFHEQKPQGAIQRNVTADEQKGLAPKPAPAASAVKERPLAPVENVSPAPLPAAAANVPRTPPPAIVPKETTQTPGKARLDLLVEAREDTWLSITEDRKPPYQITLKTGKTLNRTALESFVIKVGNAAGVNITFQGKSLGTLGRKGEVVHLRLPQQ